MSCVHDRPGAIGIGIDVHRAQVTGDHRRPRIVD
jgi:hypothetical protein